MVNMLLFLPKALAATHNENCDDDKRFKVTTYILKHHLRPTPQQMSAFDVNAYQSHFGDAPPNKGFFDSSMADATTGIFFATLMNAVLSFDNNLERFERMCSKLQLNEATMGSPEFKKRLGT